MIILNDTEKYATDLWLENKKKSYDNSCGEESRVCNTIRLQKKLSEFFIKYKISSISDCPCGHYSWISNVINDFPEIEYNGYDVNRVLIERNQGFYSESKSKFNHFDFVFQTLPYADLIICRDGFQHLPEKYIIQSLYNFRNSGSKYLISTTYPSVEVNIDPYTKETKGWGYREINLCMAPFNLGKTIGWIDEPKFNRIQGIWKLN